MNPERAAAAFWAGYIRNRNVDERTASDGAVSVGGGYALYVAETDFRMVQGAGWERPLQASDCEVVESFYADRGTVPAFELGEDAAVRDAELLAQRGYTLDRPNDVIFERLVGSPQSDGAIAVRTTRDRKEWVSILMQAMGADHQPRLEKTLQFAAAGASILTIASIDKRDVGAGGMLVTGDYALLMSGGVLPGERRRGVHGALVTARLRIAHERGATRAAIKTATGSFAARTAVRAGFARTASTVRATRGER